jgi:hypothetical protein
MMGRSQVRPMIVATPLCPAGHLPHKGGDRLGARSADNIGRYLWRAFFRRTKAAPLVISLLVGEMPGRAEGGNANHKGQPQ